MKRNCKNCKCWGESAERDWGEDIGFCETKQDNTHYKEGQNCYCFYRGNSKGSRWKARTIPIAAHSRFNEFFHAIEEKIESIFDGHITIGNLTIFGANAMHWGCHFWTKKYGYICFRLPFRCYGRWWPMYLYFSPNATPWASTFMLGARHDAHDWATSRMRRIRLGHNWDTENEEYKEEMRRINNCI